MEKRRIMNEKSHHLGKSIPVKNRPKSNRRINKKIRNFMGAEI